MIQPASELTGEELYLLSELWRRLEERLPALTAQWNRIWDDLLAEEQVSAPAELRHESVGAAQALLHALAAGGVLDREDEARAYGEAMALLVSGHTLLTRWLYALRQSLLTTVTGVYGDDPYLDQTILAFSKFFAPYMLLVTESFSTRQQRLLLEQQDTIERAYEESQRRVVELEVLNEIGRALSSTMELDQLLELIYQQTSRLMETTNFYIALCDWDQQLLRFLINQEEGIRQVPDTMPIEQGLTGHIARSGQPLFFPYGPDEFLAQQGIARVGRPSKSWLGVPMVVQEQVVGVIAVQSYVQEGAYDEGHLRVLTTIASQAAVAVENARLYQEARRQADEMEALYRLGATAGTQLSLEEILQSIYEQAGVVMDTGAFFVALYDRQRDEIAFELMYDMGERVEPFRVNKSSQGGLTGWMLDQGRSLLVRDWEEAGEELRQVVVAMGEPVRAWLGVPMVVRGEVVGIIAAQSYQTGAFDEQDQQVLEMIAHQAATAIENARLYQEARQRWQEVRMLLEVSRTSAVILDPQELLSSVLEAAIRVIRPAERGSVFLQDPHSGDLVIRAQAGYPTEVVEQVRFRPGEGFAGWVFQEKQGSIAADPTQDPRFQSVPASMEIRSLMGAPLVGRSGIIGVICLDNCSRAGAFGEADLQLLNGLSQQVSVAIDNSRLFAETSRRLEELEVLNEIGRALSSTMELDQLLELIYQQTSRLMETTNFYIALCDWEREMLDFVIRYEEGERVPRMSLEVGAGLTGYIVHSGQPLHLPFGPDEFLAQQGIVRVGRASQSWLGVPLVVQERVVGVIAVQSYVQKGAYDEGHLRVLSTIASQAAVAVENARLYQEARRRADEMEALYRTGSTVASRLSLEEILQSVYEQASVVMDTEAFFVALYDRERDEISFPLFYDQGERMEPFRVRKGERPGLTGLVLDRNESILIQNWERDASEELRRVAIAMGETVQSWLGVPLVARGEVVGVIAAQSYRAGAFDEHDRRVLEMIAHQATAGIEGARLYQEAQARVAQLSALQQIGLKLASTTELVDVLDTVADSAIELLHPSNVLIFLYDAAQQSFTLASGMNDSGERGLFSPMPRRDGLTATVACTGELVAIDDVPSHPLYVENPEQAGKLCSIVSVPLVRAGEVLGVLNVSYHSPHRFSEEEKRLMQTFADYAAVAVANAHIFRQMQSIMQEFQDTAEVQSQLLELIQELSTPVIPLIEGVLLMPLVGSIDSQRGRQVLDRLLKEVERRSAQVVLVDITGVPVVDTAVAQILLHSVKAVRLLGAETVLVGITPEVAQTLVSLGVDLADVITRADLQGGVAYASRRVGATTVGRQKAPRPGRPTR